jgi:hypothetical protein
MTGDCTKPQFGTWVAARPDAGFDRGIVLATVKTERGQERFAGASLTRALDGMRAGGRRQAAAHRAFQVGRLPADTPTEAGRVKSLPASRYPGNGTNGRSQHEAP